MTKYTLKEIKRLVKYNLPYGLNKSQLQSLYIMLKNIDLLATTTKSSKEKDCKEESNRENVDFKVGEKYLVINDHLKKEYNGEIVEVVEVITDGLFKDKNGRLFNNFDKLKLITPTPSTNIKEIELLKVDELSYCSYKQWTKIMNKINEIIYSLNTIIKK